MDIGNIIRSVIAGAAHASGSSTRTNAVATPDDNGGWTIAAGGVTETIAQGGRVRIGDTVFHGAEDGNLVVQQDGEEGVRYARPEQETATTSTTATTTTMTTVVANDEAVESVTVSIGIPEAQGTPGTMPPMAQGTPGTMPPMAQGTPGTMPPMAQGTPGTMPPNAKE